MTQSRTNQLKNEKSPYLLQHKDNPIAWMAWGEEAFRIAREENKPIFLSVGYSTCHWCHVMAHESFEDQEVAQVLNEKFISIKVDREEHPDVDDVYMTALQTLSGGGGWPMSVWLNSDGKPFFAGTYFPKYRFLQLLRRINEVWTAEPEKLVADSERLLAAIREVGHNEAQEGLEAEYEEFLNTYINHFQHHFDPIDGGFGTAPKFPQTMNLMLMMRRDRLSGLRQAEAMVTTTLGKMIRGGVYDQLAGGFHRYSVDAQWLVPHFEKMLYDQALLSVTLIEAFQLYGDPEVARGARETLDYVLSEMTDAKGGFYSAQDADSLDPISGHSEEGFFCTYTYEELKSTLSADELKRLEEVYGITPSGNFEGRNILNLQESYDGSIKSEPTLVSAFAKLKKLRASKPAPHLDDKMIAAWNGWMIWAFAKGSECFSEPKYLSAAQKALTFMHEELWQNGKLARFSREGVSKGSAAAEDYASLIHACLELYQADFDSRWAKWAIELQTALDQSFWDTDEGLYFSNDGKSSLLPMRPKDDYDGVTPCSNSMAALNLWRLYLLTGEPRFKSQAERVISSLFPRFQRHPSSLPFLGLAMDFQLSEAKVAVLNGGGWVEEFYREKRSQFLPGTLWAKPDSGWPVTEGKRSNTPSVYICEEGQCLKPALSLKEILPLR